MQYLTHLDQAQDNHDNLAPAVHAHILKALRHSAGIGPHPGKLNAPDADPGNVPNDWTTPQGNFEARSEERRVGKEC